MQMQLAMHNIKNKKTGQHLEGRLSQALLAALADVEATAREAGQPSPEHATAREAAGSAVNRLFRLMSDNNLDYVELPDGRVIATYRFVQRHTFLGINLYSQEGSVEAYIAHDDENPVRETHAEWTA